MLEYPIEEAQQLLENNLVTATKNLEEIQSDLEFLRDQRVTTEVSILPTAVSVCQCVCVCVCVRACVLARFLICVGLQCIS
jgi:hypothetical protein